jgi:hypothetical protein
MLTTSQIIGIASCLATLLAFLGLASWRVWRFFND